MAKLIPLRLLLNGVLALFLTISCSADTVAAKPSCKGDAHLIESGFVSFWMNFKSAALNSDEKSLEEMARFPLTYAGVLDSDAKHRIEQHDFAKFFADVLRQDSGMKENFYSVLDLLRATNCPPIDAVDAEGKSAQVGPFVFLRSKSGWRLTEVFSASD